MDEFNSFLHNQDLDSVVRQHVLEGVPYVFRDRPEAYEALRRDLSQTLSTTPTNITVVGSAKVGFSLHPEKDFRPFSPSSDIDVAVVNESLFDALWYTVLRWHYPRRLPPYLPESEQKWSERRMREVYWGWFVPDQIRYKGLAFPSTLVPLRDMTTRWFNAFRALSNQSQYPEFSDRDVRGRLYRTWDHVHLYHREGLRLLRDARPSHEGEMM